MLVHFPPSMEASSMKTRHFLPSQITATLSLYVLVLVMDVAPVKLFGQ